MAARRHPSDRYAHIREHGLDQDGLLELLTGIPATHGPLFLESYRARPSRAVKGVLAEQTAWERLRQASGRPLLAVNADFELGMDRDPAPLAAALLQALETLEGDLEGASLADACVRHLQAQGNDNLRIHPPTDSSGP